MPLFLDKVDAAPLSNSNFPFDFNQWVAVLVDTLNEVIQDVQDSLNILNAPSYTSAQITTLNPTLLDGVILYDTDLDVYVGKANGALVKFTVTPYP